MSDDRLLQDRVKQLEELSSHQEHFLQQLNGVVVQLRADYDARLKKMQARIDCLESLVENQAADCDLNEKPPHY